MHSSSSSSNANNKSRSLVKRIFSCGGAQNNNNANSLTFDEDDSNPPSPKAKSKKQKAEPEVAKAKSKRDVREKPKKRGEKSAKKPIVELTKGKQQKTQNSKSKDEPHYEEIQRKESVENKTIKASSSKSRKFPGKAKRIPEKKDKHISESSSSSEDESKKVPKKVNKTKKKKKVLGRSKSEASDPVPVPFGTVPGTSKKNSSSTSLNQLPVSTPKAKPVSESISRLPDPYGTPGTSSWNKTVPSRIQSKESFYIGVEDWEDYKEGFWRSLKVSSVEAKNVEDENSTKSVSRYTIHFAYTVIKIIRSGTCVFCENCLPLIKTFLHGRRYANFRRVATVLRSKDLLEMVAFQLDLLNFRP